jgi:hypothetical protein
MTIAPLSFGRTGHPALSEKALRQVLMPDPPAAHQGPEKSGIAKAPQPAQPTSSNAEPNCP